VRYLDRVRDILDRVCWAACPCDIGARICKTVSKEKLEIFDKTIDGQKKNSPMTSNLAPLFDGTHSLPTKDSYLSKSGLSSLRSISNTSLKPIGLPPTYLKWNFVLLRHRHPPRSRSISQ
jgi:hypothetical protein